jgi:hypothetical protein
MKHAHTKILSQNVALVDSKNCKRKKEEKKKRVH